MKKVLFLFLLLSFTCVSGQASSTTNIYNKAGQKVGSYRTNGNKTTIYNKAGQSTGYYKRSSNGRITEYNKAGQKIRTYK